MQYAAPSQEFKDALAALPKQYQYVLIAHFSRNNLGYLLEWAQAMPVLAIISVPYSERADVKAEVAKVASVYSPTLEQIPGTLIEVCTKNIDKEIILIEIGGYSAAVAQYLPNIVLAVEATAAGHERYRQHQDSLPYPVVSIARTSGKKQEDSAVGQAIALSVGKVIGLLGRQSQELSAAVLGYGEVGRGAASHLKKQGLTIDVYDPSAERLELARSEGYACADRSTLLASADIIVGCSGQQSTMIDDLPLLKNDAVLISGSSRQVEFPYDALQEMAVDGTQDGIVEELVIHDKTLKIINKGQPINFYFDMPLGQSFDVPMTLLAKAVAYGATQKLSAGLHELPENS